MAAIPYTIRKMPDNATLAERLENRSMWEPNSGCLLWFGGYHGPAPNNYGTMRWKGKAEKVHRLAWIDAHGPVPDGMEVCHRCDMPMCLNVGHLFLDTHVGNMADMVAKKRQRFLQGENHPVSKLTGSQVHAIRADPRGIIRVAKDYGVSKSLISAIRRREAWRHI
tara:strand:- start:103 stop:600 length:498 start_codon:yes stop_codon:yes gene_type:complete